MAAQEVGIVTRAEHPVDHRLMGDGGRTVLVDALFEEIARPFRRRHTESKVAPRNLPALQAAVDDGRRPEELPTQQVPRNLRVCEHDASSSGHAPLATSATGH